VEAAAYIALKLPLRAGRYPWQEIRDNLSMEEPRERR
jgi:hypothetical protein